MVWPHYQINGKWYSRDNLVEGFFRTEDKYLQQALEFCGRWLSGQTSFAQQTSGSTGKPKIIEITRKQMLASAEFTCNALNLREDMHALVCVNVAYIAGKMMLVRCLQQGMQMTIVNPSGNPLLDYPVQFPLHFTAMVPLQVKNVLAHSDSSHMFSQIENVIIGGAAIDEELENRLQNLTNKIYASYGMTETVSHIALRKLNGKDRQDYFQAFPEVLLGQDVRGCLSIESVLSNNKKLVTNDLVELISEHQFRWLGRADLVINSGGVKIQLEMLEGNIRQILTHEGLNMNFLVSSQTDEKLGERLVMVIEGLSDSGKILNILDLHLPAYQVPKKIISLPKFATTESGKIDRLTIKNQINERGI